MTPRGRTIGTAVAMSAVRRLRAAVFCLPLMLTFMAGPAAAVPQANPASTTHVYLLRGVLNIFSLGLDTIGSRLEAQGIPVTVTNFVNWSSLADEAAAGYKSGRLKTIILVGHSSGATALPDMVARLGQQGVPVKLAIGLDSVFKTRLSGNAERYINFYVASGAGEPVKRNADFRGKLDNVDVGTSGVGHLSIDKNEMMQQKVISAIDAVVFSRGRPTTTATVQPAAAGAVRVGATGASASARN
jgi:hypothetical protein